MFLTLQQDHLFEPWLNFKNPLVRQLAFSIASPNILKAYPDQFQIHQPFQLHAKTVWQQYFHLYQSRLLYLDQHPHELEEFLNQLKSTRLGLRFEMFVWFWLSDSDYHPYELLGHSIQQIAGTRTLGELDFLLKNTETQQIEHWEVALKYYLAECDFSFSHWYGLNRTDTLKRKLNHFTQKQFQFDQALDYPIQQRFVMLKGQLYVPLNTTIQQVPDWVNLQRRIGLWGYEFIPAVYTPHRLQRHEWLCPNDSPSNHAPQLWTDGLYCYQQQADEQNFYMYRHRPLLQYGA